MEGSGAIPAPARSRAVVVRRAPAWRVRQWEVRAGGEALCRAACVRAPGQLLLWLGPGAGATPMGALALAVPSAGAALAVPSAGAALAVPNAGAALATALAGGGAAGEQAAGLARRLARALHCPVHVCAAAEFDRFTAPLVERGLVAEIKSRPELYRC